MTNTGRLNAERLRLERPCMGRLAQGAIMIILGILAVAAPVAATITVDIYVGWQRR
jgi:uncharacterized membrane protein HdeD (DUF308 family)